MIRYLSEVCSARDEVVRFGSGLGQPGSWLQIGPIIPSISVQVVYINEDALTDLCSHKSESLRCQAIRPARIATDFPLCPLKVYPIKDGQCVQSASKGYSATGSSAERMVVIRIQSGMVIEVFLDMNNGKVVLGKE